MDIASGEAAVTRITSPTFSSPMSRFGGWLRSWMLHMATRRAGRGEWDALGRRERCRIANDLGIGDCEMSALLQDGRGSIELDKLLARTGLHETASRSGALHDLQRVCALCTDKDACRDWLAVPAKPNNHATMPGFCPNRAELNGLRVQQIRETNRRPPQR